MNRQEKLKRVLHLFRNRPADKPVLETDGVPDIGSIPTVRNLLKELKEMKLLRCKVVPGKKAPRVRPKSVLEYYLAANLTLEEALKRLREAV